MEVTITNADGSKTYYVRIVASQEPELGPFRYAISDDEDNDVANHYRSTNTWESEYEAFIAAMHFLWPRVNGTVETISL